MTTNNNPPQPTTESNPLGDMPTPLGDVLFDSHHWFLPADESLGFIHIPAGKFWMGSDDISDDEKPCHEVDLPGFWMARYPVTVAQYRAFCEGSGYQGFHPDALRSPDNHPVVQVTWHEALKYCAWLDERLAGFARQQEQKNALWQGLENGDLHVTLPSEAEWEKTARGTDGRVYPWGDEFDPTKANIDETGIGTTSPVGSIPSGASPYGALDMVGNVWEWTRSIFGKWDPEKEEPVDKYAYPYISNDGREDLSKSTHFLRVIRGASFAHDRVDTPCAYRGWDLPGSRSDAFGFRVALSLSTAPNRRQPFRQ